MTTQKNFNIRLPHEIWKFLKVESMETDKSMMQIIIELIENAKKKKDKKILTSCDAKV